MKREHIRLLIEGNVLYFIIGCYLHSTIIVKKRNASGYTLVDRYSDGKYISNNSLFEMAGISDKEKFQKEILGYSFNTDEFPSCKTPEDVIKLVQAITDYNNSKIK